MKYSIFGVDNFSLHTEGWEVNDAIPLEVDDFALIDRYRADNDQ